MKTIPKASQNAIDTVRREFRDKKFVLYDLGITSTEWIVEVVFKLCPVKAITVQTFWSLAR